MKLTVNIYSVSWLVNSNLIKFNSVGVLPTLLLWTNNYLYFGVAALNIQKLILC